MRLRSHLIVLTVVFLLASNTTELSAQIRPARKGPIPAKAPATTSVNPQVALQSKRRLEAFDKAWTTLSLYYFDGSFNRLDWNKVRLEFEPRVRRAKSDAELHVLLSEMIARLGRSHLAIIPPDVYRTIEAAKIEARVREARRSAEVSEDEKNTEDVPGISDVENEEPLAQYGIGVDLRILDGQFVITKIDSGSAAQLAGLKTGYVIDRVSDVSLPVLLRRLEASGMVSAPMKRQLIYQVITGFLNGEKGSEVTVTVIDESNTPRNTVIERKKLQTQVISLASSIPERHLNFEKRSLGDEFGYIRFDYFAVPVLDQFCSAIGDFKNKKGLVIDLRGNFGGLLATMPAFAGMLSQDKMDLGTSIFRSTAERMVGWPKAKNFKGKVVFLIDGHSTSAAEIFAAAMRESGRGFLVGDRSPGEALPSVAVELPTGAVLQYPIANYRTSTGKFLEGNGVVPDYTVPLTRGALLEGKDQQLEKGLELLRGDLIPKKLEPAAGQTAPDFLGQITAAAEPPPPPKPANPMAPSTRPGTVMATTPNSLAENKIELTASRLIDQFLQKIGGRELVNSIERYSLIGETELYAKGTKNSLQVQIFRDGPAKYAEILASPSAGEIREIHNGKTIVVQSDYGLTQEIPKFTDAVESDILSPIRSLAKTDYFTSLKYHGIFDREGRKVHLLDGKSKDGMMIALAFDADSGLLVKFTGAYYGMNFDGYEKAGQLLLPHLIERERLMTISFQKISINTPIDQSNFAKKEKCFDKEN